MLDTRFSHLYFYQSLNRPQRGLSAIAELLVLIVIVYRVLEATVAYATLICTFYYYY